MKPSLYLKGSLIGLSLAGVTLVADKPDAPDVPGLNKNGSPSAYYSPKPLPGQTNRVAHLGYVNKASETLGLAIQNLQGEKLGKIQELAVELETGRIVEVIVTEGGLLGEARVTSVPPTALSYGPDFKSLSLDASKDKFKASPIFDGSKWKDPSWDASRLTETYNYYGRDFYSWEADISSSSGRTPREQTDIATGRTYRLAYVEKASRIIGLGVRNLQDESIGKVDDLLVDLTGGHVVQVIVSSGGLLGIGGELSAVPPTAFRYNPARDGLWLDASKTSLSQAPHFKGNEWPDLNRTDYAETVYRAYRIEPYFRKSDRSTPLDQGTSEADLNTTIRIRKEILNLTTLSVSAQNVKVITENGKVTLRGAVTSEQEKRILVEIANNVARPGNVESYLEVRSRDSNF
ncbi:MAG TPA: PRC-barrel domain-containing protein [Candidatus Limnocylindria bacterium]|jgi:sporulation protein YlmC with PRC-barrel domain|nr:PRC-barrel domain-containing protein [Candidatus Limnocylindria bacterium]